MNLRSIVRTIVADLASKGRYEFSDVEKILNDSHGEILSNHNESLVKIALKRLISDAESRLIKKGPDNQFDLFLKDSGLRAVYSGRYLSGAHAKTSKVSVRNLTVGDLELLAKKEDEKSKKLSSKTPVQDLLKEAKSKMKNESDTLGDIFPGKF